MALENETDPLLKSQEEISRQRALFEALNEASIDGILMVSPDNRIVYHNRRLLEMWHAHASLATVGEDDRLIEHMLGLVKSPEHFLEKVRYLNAHPEENSRDELQLKDGQVFDRYSTNISSPDGGSYGRIWFFRDITERKKNEEELRRGESHYRSIFESSLTGIAMSDANFTLIEVNDAFCSMLGYERDELIGRKTFADISHPDDAVTSVAMVKKLVSHEIDHYAIEKRYLKKSGETIDALLFVRGFYDRNGEYEGSTGSILDITDRKKAEVERFKLEQQLLHTQKLESLGILAGGIAHDFNNILTAIVGNTELALMRMNPESPALDNIRRIEKAAVRATDLAKQMLAYSGKGRFVIETLDMNRLIEEMGHMLEVSISKKTILRYNLTTPLPSVDADATQMRQIVMNLVINASEAIGERSGVVAITTGCMDCDRSYLKDVWLNENIREGLYVFFEIADSGSGMDRETMTKIFDPFFTTKFTGRGLGMAAVLGIVRGHKGAIKVYSEPGKGSSFKILLPASSRPAELFNCDTQVDGWQGRGGMVLLVDDEENVRGIGREMLQELGFETVTAGNGREALSVFRERSDISLVILDLTMPQMDGEQCFRELRTLNPDVRVIISSGYNEQEVTQKFVGKGLAGFIQKPYTLSNLKEVIRAAFGSVHS